jgi:hypothetical protein
LWNKHQLSIKGLTQKTDTVKVKVVVIKNTKYPKKKNRAQYELLSGYKERAKIKMTKQQIKTGAASLLVGVLAPLALLVPSVSAATVNWSGYAEESDNTTANVANWFDAVPVTDDSAVFGVGGNYQEIDNDIVGLSLEKLIFSGNNTFGSSKSYNITGKCNYDYQCNRSNYDRCWGRSYC